MTNPIDPKLSALAVLMGERLTAGKSRYLSKIAGISPTMAEKLAAILSDNECYELVVECTKRQ